jgi:hypothetical protein
MEPHEGNPSAGCRYSLRQAGSTFHIGRENSERFGLYAGDMIFNIQNNEYVCVLL